MWEGAYNGMKAILLAVFLSVPVLAQQPAVLQEIQTIIEKYAKSIDAADTILAAEIWSQSQDVSFIHPRGHEHGFDQVKQDVYVQMTGTRSRSGSSPSRKSPFMYMETPRGPSSTGISRPSSRRMAHP